MKNLNTRSYQNPSRKYQYGLTLIELMIAITISLFLLGGVIQIFVSNKQTYRVQDASARIQESGRFGLYFLNSDIRMAGYTGCGSITTTPTNMADLDGDGVADQVGSFTGNGLQGYEYDAALSVPLTDALNLTAANIIAGTDVITIKRAVGTGVQLAGNTVPTNANIQIDPTTGAGMFAVNDILFISDCTKSDIFALNSVAATGGGGGAVLTISHSAAVNTGNFISPYGTDAQVMKMVNTTFYIATGASGEPSLFRYSMGNNGVMAAQELVEGVSNMQIIYGEDTDSDSVADVYYDADSVTNMVQVVSVQIVLTVRSKEDNVSTVQNSGDYRLRRTFTSTTTIRNRVS